MQISRKKIDFSCVKQILLQKKLFVWIVVIYLIFAVFFFANIIEIFKDFRTNTNDSSSFNKQILKVETVVSQSVRLSTHSLREIVVLFFLTDPEIDGQITVSLQDPQTGEVVLTGTKTYKPAEGEREYKLKSSNPIKVRKKKYLLSVHGNNISLKSEKDTSTFIYRIYGSVAAKYLIVLSVAYWIFVFLVLFLVLWLVYKKSSLPVIYLICSLLFGSVIMLVLPPFAVPDEKVHFNSAYNLSNVLEGKGSIQINGGLLIRACDTKILPKEYSSNPDLLRDLSEITKISGYKKYYPYLAKNVKAPDEPKIIKVDRKITNSVIGYIPQTIGILVARFLGLNQFGLFYSGRFFNLLFCSLFIFLGLKISKIEQILFFVIALLPMVLQQASSYSYDGLLNTMAFVFAMTIVSFYNDRKLDKGRFITALISGLTLFSLKSFTYSPILLLSLILIKKNYFYSIKKRLLYSLLLIITVLIIMLFLRLFFLSDNSTVKTVVSFYGKEKIMYDVGFLIKQPFEYLRLFFNTFSSHFFIFLSQMTGGIMAVRNVHISDFLFSLLVFSLFITTLENSQKTIQLKSVFHKVILFCIIFAVLNTVSVAMLLFGTDFGGYRINGIQGRYFLPVLPIILLLFKNKMIIKKDIFKETLVSIVLLDALVSINLIFELLN